MNPYVRNPILSIDFYKVGHVSQYPKGTTKVWSNFTPRSSRVPDQDTIVNFGLNYFIKEYLIDTFNELFFRQPKQQVISQYSDFIKRTLFVENPKTDHIERLHNLGYLPLEIWALPEGNSVNLRVPTIIFTNTLPDFFWLPNYFETIFSAYVWKPSTSATTAQKYRRIFTKWARIAGETDLSFIDWQGHDFSFRGMVGVDDPVLSGMGHLLSFTGTDTAPAILGAEHYYGATGLVGGSVPATEHSVMCAGTQEGEYDTFKRLITETYPSGIVSIVSDTWDLWKVLTDIVPRLKNEILAREGKVVIRPDSGNPEYILCGDPNKGHSCPEADGVLRLLRQAVGVTERGNAMPLINKMAAIYGDAINFDRSDKILGRIVQELKLSPFNQVFGIGSYTYEYVTRDTYGWAMKATAVERDGQIVPIFKKPVTDDGTKFSAKGILAVHGENGNYHLVENTTEDEMKHCAYERVFLNSDLLIDPSFETLRKRVREVI